MISTINTHPVQELKSYRANYKLSVLIVFRYLALLSIWLISLKSYADPPDWIPVPNLQYNMQIVAKLQLDENTYSIDEEDLVAGFVDGECRGLASPNASLDGIIFLSIGSNVLSGETITFKAYLSELDLIFNLNETITFESMEEVGTYLDPFIFTINGIEPPVQYTIIASSGENGAIQPEGNIQVNHGDSQTFAITPDEGYDIDDLLVDGISVGALESYTFENVTADHTIEASFSLLTYTISASAAEGGSIAPSGTVSLNHGDSQTVAITPDEGYDIDDLLVDGISVGALESYTFENVTADHTIEASFSLLTYTISASAGNGGNIIPSGTIIVPHGASQLFTFTPDLDYEVFDVEINGESVGNPESYEFEQVTANQTIHVSFALISSAHAHILRNDGFRVFPNPASQLITIAVENKKIDHFSYSIADQNGKQVLQGEIKSNLQQINLSPLKNGIYVLQLRQHNKLIASEKVIKYDW